MSRPAAIARNESDLLLLPKGLADFVRGRFSVLKRGVNKVHVTPARETETALTSNMDAWAINDAKMNRKAQNQWRCAHPKFSWPSSIQQGNNPDCDSLDANLVFNC